MGFADGRPWLFRSCIEVLQFRWQQVSRSDCVSGFGSDGEWICEALGLWSMRCFLAKVVVGYEF